MLLKRCLRWQNTADNHLKEELLDESFIPIHRFFIISIEKIKSFNNASIGVADNEQPIERQFKT